MKILLLGSNHPSTATAYQSFDLPQSILVDSINQDFEIGHTARQEFGSDDDLELVLSKADRVYWTFPDICEFLDPNEYYQFLEWLKKYNNKHGNICNFYDIHVDPYHWKSKLPSLTHEEAVFFGCSFTAGVGIPDQNQRWTDIVSRHFGKKCVNLGKGGSSNQYAFDLISNIKILPGQIVVWQLTHLDRIFYCNENREMEHIILASTDHDKRRSMIDILTIENMMYDLQCKINLVVKLCRSVGARFVFWPIDYKEHSTFSFTDLLYFYHFPEFIPAYQLHDFIVDFGTDGIHPGVESNKIVAESVIAHIERLYR